MGKLPCGFLCVRTLQAKRCCVRSLKPALRTERLETSWTKRPTVVTSFTSREASQWGKGRYMGAGWAGLCLCLIHMEEFHRCSCRAILGDKVEWVEAESREPLQQMGRMVSHSSCSEAEAD